MLVSHPKVDRRHRFLLRRWPWLAMAFIALAAVATGTYVMRRHGDTVAVIAADLVAQQVPVVSVEIVDRIRIRIDVILDS